MQQRIKSTDEYPPSQKKGQPMKQTIDFDIPRGMTPEDIAKAFNAYLQDHPVLHKPIRRPHPESDKFFYGPFEKTRHGETSWQLDCSNDYWLHVFIPGSRATLSCRYPAQVPTIEAMVELLNERHSPSSEANSK